MSLPVVLRRVAQAEFDDAADWYEQRRAGRGTAFTAAVRHVLTEIGTHPDRYPEVRGEVREAPVAGYPYTVFYRPGAARVVVIAVFHTSRDPAEWQKRA